MPVSGEDEPGEVGKMCSAACCLPSLIKKSDGLDGVAEQNVERKHYFFIIT